jgi:hypothetical protein
MTRTVNRRVPFSLIAVLLGVATSISPAAGQDVPFAVRAPDGAMHLWSFDEQSGMTLPEIDDVTLLPIERAGARAMDRLRDDLPAVRGADTPAPHIRLPQGGALYRVQTGDQTALMHVTSDGALRLVVTRPASESGPSIRPTLFVSNDGRTVVAATGYEVGGDVLLVDLTGRRPVQVLTNDANPLHVDTSTLRASPNAVWFVAEGVLHVATPDGAGVRPVEFDLLLPHVLPDVVMNRAGRWVAVVVQFETSSALEARQRHIFLVDETGGTRRVTAEPGAYPTAAVDQPLGSRLSVGPQGHRVAYTDTDGQLFVRDLGTVGDPRPLLPTPPVQGVKRVSLIHFADALTLRFLAFPAAGGPAQVFEARLPDANDSPLRLATHPSVGADLALDDVVFDPAGGVLLLAGRVMTRVRGVLKVDDTQHALDVLDLRVAGSPRRTALKGLRSTPRLVPAGPSVLVVSTPGTQPKSRDKAVISMTAKVLGSAADDGVSIVHLVADQVGIQLDRFSMSRGGRVMAFAGSVGPGLESPVFLDMHSGVIRRAWQSGLELSPVLAFSATDALYLGMSSDSTDYMFGSFPSPGHGRMIHAMPQGYGFPLQH